jgi:hypothetical protein
VKFFIINGHLRLAYLSSNVIYTSEYLIVITALPSTENSEHVREEVLDSLNGQVKA